MPIREYIAKDAQQACAACRCAFERLEKMHAAPLTQCPDCGAPVERLISAASVGASRSSLDTRAKKAGFHKLKRLGRGEYEKQY